MKQSKKIAVTGGIGSGKTAALSLLAGMGYPVFSCDEISRELWKDETYLKILAEAFPACTEEGKIVKSRLSALIFSDTGERKRLEAIAHPRIMRQLSDEMEKHAVSFAEVPLLFEGGYETLFDGVLLVEREEGERIAAVMQRDGISETEVKRRISAQFSDTERKREGIAVVQNSGSLAELEKNLRLALHSLGL